MTTFSIYILALILPAFCGLTIYLVKRRYFILPAVSLFLLTGIILVTYSLFALEPAKVAWEWLPNLDFAWNIDRLAVILVALVLLISMLVHIFSFSYMEREPGVFRYYLKLGLFTSAMIGLLGADHLLLLFLFWELVGFFSYLLIGFWFSDKKKASAARNAFITNRVADVCLLGGIFFLGLGADTFLISSISATENTWTIIGSVGLLLGAMGKSAQFPFHTWLPHAMAGPTPVSALIHAATMVAAGVYLLVRMGAAFPEEVRILTAIVGAVTALMAAFFAMTQFDIKKVLAYSTISQLGYMVMAIGVGAREMAFFHLWTHAFFKAGLFLAAGAVIHYFHHQKNVPDPQDMRSMGGLRKAMPWTYWCYTVCMASLIGLPFFTGFLSKDGILVAAVNWSLDGGAAVRLVIPAVAFFTVFLTAYYMVRQWKMVFYGTKSADRSPETWIQLVPLLTLALASVWFWYAVNPFGHEYFLLDWVFGGMAWSAKHASLVMTFSLLLAAAGVWSGWKQSHALNHRADRVWLLSHHGMYLDQFYQLVVVTPYNRLSAFCQKLDRQVIDSSLHMAARSTVVLSKLVQFVDKHLLDGLVNFTAYFAGLVGGLLKKQQSYNLQMQLIWMFLSVILILWFLLNEM